MARKARGPTATAIVAVLPGCCSRCPRDSTIYIPRSTRFQAFRGVLRPADFCCSCCCCECCCGCCECCDLRRSVCCAASWQFVVGGVLGSAYAAVTALSFHYEPSFLEVNAQIVALMIHLLVFWWLYFLTGIVGCCTTLDRQGILTYDPRVLFMSRTYVGLNVLCAVCHVTLALLNKGLWGAPLTRLNIFVTFLPLAWDWYILYLAWSLARKLREQRKGVFRGKPVMANQRKPGQLLELHSGHNLALRPPPNQIIVPLANAVTAATAYGGGGGAAAPSALRRSTLGTRWSAPSGDTLTYASGGAAAAMAAAAAAAPPPHVMDRISRSAVAASGGGGVGWGGSAQTLLSCDDSGLDGGLDGGASSDVSSSWDVADSNVSGGRGGGGSSLGAGGWRTLRRRQVMDSDGAGEEAPDGDYDGDDIGQVGGGGDGWPSRSGGWDSCEGEPDGEDGLGEQRHQQRRTRAPASLLPMPPASVPLPPLAQASGRVVVGARDGGGDGAAGLPESPDVLAAILEEEAAANMFQGLSHNPHDATQQQQQQQRRQPPHQQEQEPAQDGLAPGASREHTQQRRRRTPKAPHRRRVLPHGSGDGSPLTGPGGVEPPSLPERDSDSRHTAAAGRARAAAAPAAAASAAPDAAGACAPVAVFELRELSTRPSFGGGPSASAGGALSGHPALAAAAPSLSSAALLASPRRGGGPAAPSPSWRPCAARHGLAGARPHNPPLPAMEPVVLTVPARAMCGSALFSRSSLVGGAGLAAAAAPSSSQDVNGDGAAPAAVVPPAGMRKAASLSRRALFQQQLSLQRTYALLHNTPPASQASVTAMTTPAPAQAPGGAAAAPAEPPPPDSPRHQRAGGAPPPHLEVAVRMRDSDTEEGPEPPARKTPPPGPHGASRRASLATTSVGAAAAGGAGVGPAPAQPPSGRHQPSAAATFTVGQTTPYPPPPPLHQQHQALKLQHDNHRPHRSDEGATRQVLPPQRQQHQDQQQASHPPSPPPPLQLPPPQQQQVLGPWPPPGAAASGFPALGRGVRPARSVQGSSGGASDGGGAASDGGRDADGWRRTDGAGGGGGAIHASSSAKTLREVRAGTGAPPSADPQLAPPRMPPLPLHQLGTAPDLSPHVKIHSRAQSYSLPSYQQPAPHATRPVAAGAAYGAGAGLQVAPASGGVGYTGVGWGGAVANPHIPWELFPDLQQRQQQHQHQPQHGAEPQPPSPPSSPRSRQLQQQQQQYPHTQHLRQQRQRMGARGASGARPAVSTRFGQQQQQQVSSSGGGDAGEGVGPAGSIAAAARPLAAVGDLAARAGASAAALWGAISGDWRTQHWEEQQHGPGGGEAPARAAAMAFASRLSFWAPLGRGPIGAVPPTDSGGDMAAVAESEETPRVTTYGSVQPPPDSRGARLRVGGGGSLASLVSPLGLQTAVANVACDGVRAVYDKYGTYVGRAVRGMSVGAVFWGSKPAHNHGRGNGADGRAGGGGGGAGVAVHEKEGSGGGGCQVGGESGGGGAGARNRRNPVMPIAEITPFSDDA